MNKTEFYMGATCKQGHSGKRYRKGRHCVACAKDPAQLAAVRARSKARRSTTKGRTATLFSNIKQRAGRKGLRMTLTQKWLEDRLTVGRCDLSGLEFDLASPLLGPFSPSVDRIDSSKGYTEDNCRVILWALNAAFGSWGEAVFRDISLAWLERSEAKPTNSYIMAA